MGFSNEKNQIIFLLSQRYILVINKMSIGQMAMLKNKARKDG